MQHLGRVLSALLLASLVAGPALASKGVREFEVKGTAELDLVNISGNISIQPGTNEYVVITYEKTRDHIEIDFDQSANGRIRVEVVHRGGNHSGTVHFTINFPVAHGRLNIQSTSGNIEIQGIAGKIRLKTISGDVRANNASGQLDLSAVSGDIALSGVDNAEVDASTISGDVTYRNGALNQGDYSFASTSGNVSVTHTRNASYDISGRTISGSIRNRVGPELTVTKSEYGPQTTIDGARLGGKARLRVNTVSGSIDLNMDAP